LAKTSRWTFAPGGVAVGGSARGRFVGQQILILPISWSFVPPWLYVFGLPRCDCDADPDKGYPITERRNFKARNAPTARFLAGLDRSPTRPARKTRTWHEVVVTVAS
jgi:hypothetical protein